MDKKKRPHLEANISERINWDNYKALYELKQSHPEYAKKRRA